MDVTLPLAAVAAGVVSFSSPCCLPLVPSYLSYMSALPASELDDGAARSLTLRAAVLFVTGFTIVFTALGASAGLAGSLLLRHLDAVVRVAGVGIVVMGAAMLGWLRIPLLGGERRIDLARLPTGPRGALPMGMAFAAGWVPCIGPVLATILAVAAATETVAWGALLLALYSLGLGIPFVLLALGFQRARRSAAWLRRHGRGVERVGGLLLIGVGILFVSGAWRDVFLPLQRQFARWGWPPI